jgi:hypothetical protein
LEDVLVASQDVDRETLMALGKAGVSIVQPPKYVLELMQLEGKVEFTKLDPGSANNALKVSVFS